MLLCDVGNSNASILDGEKFYSLSIKEFLRFKSDKIVFYINVNERLKDILANKTNYINIEPYFDFNSTYKGLGIDRIAACYTIDNGIIIDAGSAISTDLMKDTKHLGGFILPGFISYQKAFEDISIRLKYDLNKNVNIHDIPLNTIDAMSYASFKSIILTIKDFAKDKKLYFTGGDGEYLSSFFDNSIYDKLLIFKGMKKAIKENEIYLRGFYERI